MNYYHPPCHNHWSCRADAKSGDYFCHNITCLDLSQDNSIQQSFGILGFASDLGVQNNLGRLGAKDSPLAIRQFLSRLTVPHSIPCYDCGDVIVDNSASLLEAQQLLATKVTKLLNASVTPIVLGGGHETAYGHFLGIMPAIDDVAILNFDAHFDLRPVNADNEGTSGTPFRQIYNECMVKGRNFNYYCVGIQPFANVKELYTFANQVGCEYIEAAQIHSSTQIVNEFIANIIKKHKHIYVTICLDVFHYSYAPGVSAPQVQGIHPQIVINSLNQLRKSNKVIALDIVELNPVYDIDNHTARLAANLIAEFLYAK